MQKKQTRQDSATKDAASHAVTKTLKALEAAEGVIFRTKLNERGETAVVFPNKRPSATTLEVHLSNYV